MLRMFVTATKWTTAANAILLQYTAPLFVALLSWPMLGERVSGWEWGALSGVLLGMAFFFGEKLSLQGLCGNILAIASGVACALNTLFLRRVTFPPPRPNSLIPTDAPLHETVISDMPATNISGGLLLSLPATVLGNILITIICMPAMITGLPTCTSSWLIKISLGLFQLGLSYVLFNIGLRYVTAVEATILATIEAVLNPIWTALGTGENPSGISLAGGGLILASVLFYGWFKNKVIVTQISL
ncbi:MAG: EamA family transporter [Candidatus Riflebacteria bacterium]|nr:EamA family transporter [Candidatus Riflebacteria bacterium]